MGKPPKPPKPKPTPLPAVQYTTRAVEQGDDMGGG